MREDKAIFSATGEIRTMNCTNSSSERHKNIQQRSFKSEELKMNQNGLDRREVLSVGKIIMPGSQPIVAIGTSTGGPKALLAILKRIPADFPAAILIVQHMPAGFTKSLANRLNLHVDIHVKEASHAEVIQSGMAYIAPGNYHMRLRKKGFEFEIGLSQEAKEKGHRPSVDILFESLSLLPKLQKIAVVLTGMGSDGAEGVISLKKESEKCIVIAESKETSIVYGMPKAVYLTNHVDYVVGLNQVSSILLKVLGR